MVHRRAPLAAAAADGAAVLLFQRLSYRAPDGVLPARRIHRAFLQALRSRGIDATIRREKGHDIDAACGQLRLQTVRDKTFAAVSEVR